jgi:hypothetical protein
MVIILWLGLKSEVKYEFFKAELRLIINIQRYPGLGFPVWNEFRFGVDIVVIRLNSEVSVMLV